MAKQPKSPKEAPAHEDAAAATAQPADAPQAVGSPADAAPAAPADPQVPPKEEPAAQPEHSVDELPVFVRKHEDSAAARGAERGEQIVVVEISHPSAGEDPIVYQGRDGGIRMSRGQTGAVYSDGSKHTTP